MLAAQESQATPKAKNVKLLDLADRDVPVLARLVGTFAYAQAPQHYQYSTIGGYVSHTDLGYEIIRDVLLTQYYDNIAFIDRKSEPELPQLIELEAFIRRELLSINRADKKAEGVRLEQEALDALNPKLEPVPVRSKPKSKAKK